MPRSTKPASEPFPVRHVAQVEPIRPDRLWLVDDLWLEQGVGVLGGPPKSWKTWFAIELALAVATGAPALRRFAVRRPGPVLFFGAEDSQPALRARFEGLARSRGLPLDRAQVLLLDVPTLRLDRAQDLARLEATLRAHRPRLLVLDPFVRLARIDENSAAEVSAVLGALRELQRAHEVAVLLVHHARKASGASPSQAFRGSGDFAAWGDSNLHVSRRGGEVLLALEHRSAAAPDPLRLRLEPLPAPHLVLAASDARDGGAGGAAALAGGAEPGGAHEKHLDDLERQLLARLRAAPAPVPTRALRDVVRRRKADVLAALDGLLRQGLVERAPSGWSLPPERASPPAASARTSPREHPVAPAEAPPGGQCSLFPP